MATKRDILKEHTISSIMTAAAAEFSERGYGSTTIRSIASRAGVASGLVCTYFDSKEKLLCRIIDKYSPDAIFEGVKGTTPYAVLCAYLDHIRSLQRNDPVQFSFRLKVAGKAGFPGSVYARIREGFKESRIEAAIITAQRNGQLIKGDPFMVFETLSGTAYVLLDRYAEMDAEAPDNNALLNVIGFKINKGTIFGPGMTEYDPKSAPADPFDGFEINDDTIPLLEGLSERIPGGFFIYRADDGQELIFFNSFWYPCTAVPTRKNSGH